MIVTKTPLRVSLFGGGTDYPEYFNKYPATIISTTIDKYIYVMVNKRHDNKIRVAYSQTELVNHVDDIQHDLIRECLKMMGITGGIEIATMADIPGQGSGLGSSSAVTVGALNALNAYRWELDRPSDLAKYAIAIESEIVGNGSGYQDQIAAAFGGFSLIRIRQGDFDCVPMLYGTVHFLSNKFLLFFTGTTRKALYILQDMQSKMPDNLDRLHAIRLVAEEAAEVINDGRDINLLGPLLDRSWQLKKYYADGVSNAEIDTMYETAKTAGATGGKICGAGGGGYMLLFCPTEEIKTAVRSALSPNYKELLFRFSQHGSQVVYSD